MARRSFYNYLDNYITSQAAVSKNGLVEHGYGQVEPNHLSAQYTGQIYAQLPADASINVLEQGQFVKYDYAAHTANGAPGLVNFTGAGEWMLVYNETKLYYDDQRDCEFAMLKDNYDARIYSPFDPDKAETIELDANSKKSRFYSGDHGDSTLSDGTHLPIGIEYNEDGSQITVGGKSYPVSGSVASNTENYRDFGFTWTDDPYHIMSVPKNQEQLMPAGTKMVPRVFKTNVGDIYTTNMVLAKWDNLSIGSLLYVGDYGILTPTKKTTANAAGAVSGDMVWQVVRKYTTPDDQKGVKLMRIA